MNIEKRAQQIRKMKINELKEEIAIYEKLKKENSNYYDDPEKYKKICDELIEHIKEKLKMI
jgi:hypothetical protein